MEDAPAAASLAACGDTTPVEAAPLAAVNGDVPDSDGYFNSYENFEVGVHSATGEQHHHQMPLSHTPVIP